ncbi:MAG: hypothetical protein KAR35_05070, partial [Candidatus Heimdallarchaeota archaeon]|nr:hypothetical protein [Candidatus Heimdallarchaeota archaeon]MCK5048728.1 hypothetical protein [Candidatus Heimdallarchaeota archaeon]
MSKEVQDDLSERLKSREHVEQLITQGKLEQTMKIIEGRKNEEGVEEIRWGILESKCRASMGEFEQVIE